MNKNKITELYLADKPAGISTHSPSPVILGLVEFLSEREGRNLFVCHRLDKETSGAILFATSKEVAAEIAKEFEKQEVKKKYYFVTDRSPNLPEQIEVESEIVKVENSYISKNSKEPNSKTLFKKLKEIAKFSLWEASPTTGKTHQIRLHAQDLGLQILGDIEHGGSFFPRLMLHAQEIIFTFQNQEIIHQSTLPESFTNLEILNDIILAEYYTAIDRRFRLFDFKSSGTSTYRLIHNQGIGMSADLLGDYLWCYWYDESLPLEQDLKRIQNIASYLKVKGWKIQLMQNRGKDPVAHQNLSTIPELSWIGAENEVKYLFKKEQGYSPGLFLDQRANRKWVKENSKNLRVLNLFCYTAGFSVCAALGGAKEVVSVDTSKATLDWAKENFALNNLDAKQFEFWGTDARQFLVGAKKRKREFDLIICDPPSFARNKQGIFKLERDFKELLSEIYELLAPSGRILFSVNLEKWTFPKFKEEIVKANLKNAKIEATPLRDLDYEMPGEELVMKSLFVIKES